MTDETLFGQKGIDTPYERELIDHNPQIEFPQKKSTYQISRDTFLTIERSKEFLISQAILDYQELVNRLDDLLVTIEKRTHTDTLQALKERLANKKFHDVMEMENEITSYDVTGDYEVYTILYRMRDSAYTRMEFLSGNYRTQFTEETDSDLATEAELNAIMEWEKAELDLNEAYEEVSHDTELANELEGKLKMLENRREALSSLHTTLADTAYIHKNRYVMFEDIINQAESLVNHPQMMISGNVRTLMDQLVVMKNLGAMQAHLILTYRVAKDQHNALKGKQLMVDDQKEQFASEKSFFYQQLKTNTVTPLRDWLYEQEEDLSDSLDLFAGIMVESIDKTSKQYDSTLADLLNFYQNETVFYDQQMTFLQKKEQIRLFLSILKDLEETEEVTDEWADEYLRVNGYDS